VFDYVSWSVADTLTRHTGHRPTRPDFGECGDKTPLCCGLFFLDLFVIRVTLAATLVAMVAWVLFTVVFPWVEQVLPFIDASVAD
jgi:hypothetical protein